MEKNNRPYIFCHMETSLDGKIMGKYLWIEEIDHEEDSFYELFSGKNAAYKPQALFNGRITIEDNFTFYKTPELDENSPTVPDGDFLANNSDTNFYLIVADSSGKIAWKNGILKDFYGYNAQVVEILTDKASNSYKNYLREKNISYLICGEEKIDLEIACEKIKKFLHVDNMMLGGGGAINWSFIQKGLCDEVSIVIAPAADGNVETQSLFMAQKNFSDDQPIIFKVKDMKLMNDGKVWLRYSVEGKSKHDFSKDAEYLSVQKMISEQKVKK